MVQVIVNPSTLKQRLKSINFFRQESSTSSSPNMNDTARMASCIYAILLPLCLSVLAFFYGISQQSISVKVQSPSLIVYEQIQTLYSATISCPCKQIAIPFSNFSSVSSTFHQVSEHFADGHVSVRIELGFLQPSLFTSVALRYVRVSSSLQNGRRRYMAMEI